MLRSLEELRQLAATGPAPEVNWDVLNAQIDKLPAVQATLQSRLEQMETAYADLVKDAETMDSDELQALANVIGSALAIRIVEGHLFARTLATAQAVIEITQ